MIHHLEHSDLYRIASNLEVTSATALFALLEARLERQQMELDGYSYMISDAWTVITPGVQPLPEGLDSVDHLDLPIAAGLASIGIPADHEDRDFLTLSLLIAPALREKFSKDVGFQVNTVLEPMNGYYVAVHNAEREEIAPLTGWCIPILQESGIHDLTEWESLVGSWDLVVAEGAAHTPIYKREHPFDLKVDEEVTSARAFANAIYEQYISIFPPQQKD